MQIEFDHLDEQETVRFDTPLGTNEYKVVHNFFYLDGVELREWDAEELRKRLIEMLEKKC